ncbi:MAG: ABC transporter permease subunit [Spirochaetes bacterium]|nr:ABC transporter permease subunit [Spirochaetota bacterium]
MKNDFDQPVKGRSLWQDAWRRLKRNRMAFGGLIIIILYAIVAFSAPILPFYSYKYQVLDHQNLPPSLSKTAGELLYEITEKNMLLDAETQNRSSLNAEEQETLRQLKHKIDTETKKIDGKEEKVHNRKYILGTDNLGRDMLARVIYGSQVSIVIGLIGACVAVLIGTVMGAIAGYVGGKVDTLIMRFVDILYSLPYMLLVIIFMAIWGRSIFNLVFAVALISWLTVARVVRGQIMSLKNSEFVEAARSIGASQKRIIFLHLVPNTLGIIVVFATLRVPVFIMFEAFLSFLGLGVQAPYASWGSLVREGVQGMTLYPWRLFAPSVAMIIFLFSMNFLGDGLRDALDPQSKNRL